MSDQPRGPFEAIAAVPPPEPMVARDEAERRMLARFRLLRGQQRSGKMIIEWFGDSVTFGRIVSDGRVG